MESRVDKYRQYRQEIKDRISEKKEEKVIEKIDPIDLQLQQENYKKRNTLTMSIDQIIEAHDEYTTIIEQKSIEEKLRYERKMRNKARFQKIAKYGGFSLGIIALFVLLIIIIFKLLG